MIEGQERMRIILDNMAFACNLQLYPVSETVRFEETRGIFSLPIRMESIDSI